MKAGPELRAWLLDPERQSASRDEADAMTTRWSDHPLFCDLKAELAAMDVRAMSSLMAAANKFMDRLQDIDGLLSEFIIRAKANPFFCPPLSPVVTEINTGHLLFADPCVTIGLGVIGADALAAKKLGASGTTAISFTGLLTSYRFLKSGGATMSFWEAAQIDGDFTGDISRSCRFVGRRKIEDGEALIIDGRCQSIVIEHLISDMLCLQATVQAEAAPLSVNYDSRTLRYLSATSTDEASSRTQMMVTLLRLMDRTDAVPIIKKALESPHFYTRWHVMRELLALDAEAALPSLRHMAAADPHPEVRFAATQTLSLFFNEESEEMLLCRA
jgi:hypothetical protein